MAIEHEEDIKDEKNPRPLDEDDIALLKTYVTLSVTPDPASFLLLHRYLKLFAGYASFNRPYGVELRRLG